MIRKAPFLSVAAFLGGVIVVVPGRVLPGEVDSCTFEHWYAVRLMNKPIGWAQMRQVDQPAGKTSHGTMHVEISRGNSISKIEVVYRFDETNDGRPIQSVVTMQMGLKKTTTTMRYRPDSIEIVDEQPGPTRRRVVDLPKQPWLAPAAAKRYVEEQITGGHEDIRFWTVDPMAGVEPFETRMQLRGREDIEVLGKVVPAIVWDTTMSIMPGMVTKLFTDEQGHDLKTTFNVLPGVPFEMIRADKQIAQAQTDPPEMLLSALVKPDRPISDPRKQRLSVFKVQFAEPRVVPSGSAPTATDVSAGDVQLNLDGQVAALERFDLPTTGYQHVRWIDRRTAEVTVSLDAPVAPNDDDAGAIHLRASLLLNHEDPEVRRLTREALAGEPKVESDAEKAERMRHFVRDYVKTKDLSVGFATASEVARTAQGDCSEHAVLFAAMLRTEGIPSRTVTGVIYTNGPLMGHKDVFVYHMWTQAWLPTDVVDGARSYRWVDLDATRRVPYDATHITLGYSTLDDSEFFNELVALAPMIGNLSIEVVKTAQ